MNNEDIFEFYGEIEYTIVLVGNIQLVGKVLGTFNNGVMMEDGTRIPQDKILFFRADVGTDTE